MDEAFKTIIAQSPGTAAVILVAWLFLKELRAQRTEYFCESQTRVQALKDIAGRHDATIKECSEKLMKVGEENTRLLVRTAVALEHCETAHKENGKKPS